MNEDVTNIDTLTALAYKGKGYSHEGVDFTSNYLVQPGDAGARHVPCAFSIIHKSNIDR